MVDFDVYVRQRHWTRKKRKEQERMMRKGEAHNREFHTMKCAVDTIREVFPKEIKDGTRSSSTTDSV